MTTNTLIPFWSIAFGLFLFTSCSDDTEDVNTCNGSLRIKILETNDAVQSIPIGTITMESSGGAPPYKYSINDDEFVDAASFSDLAGGTYSLTVRDANGCTDSESVFIKEQLVVSYKLDVKPIIQANCNIALCHCNGNSLCFEEYSEVIRNQVEIGERTAQRAMPPDYSGKLLTENEIVDIGNWIYQGAQNN